MSPDTDSVIEICNLFLGVQVKFEDNVIVWIDKLRDLMYLDDEPVKSWKLDKGTKVRDLDLK